MTGVRLQTARMANEPASPLPASAYHVPEAFVEGDLDLRWGETSTRRHPSSTRGWSIAPLNLPQSESLLASCAGTDYE